MTTDPLDTLTQPFTREQAAKIGVGSRDLRRGDVTRLSRGLYMSSDVDPRVVDRVAAHLHLAPDAWASHTTAAAIHGLWLPESASDQEMIHLSRPAASTRVRRTGVIGHHVCAFPGEVETVPGGVRVSTPARTWLDLGSILGHEALVVVGDQLIRQPRTEFEGRDSPYATKRGLVSMLADHRRMRGVAKCRDALHAMRVGSDSAPETLLRLSLLAHNFPEPELQIRLHDYDPASFSADLGYRLFRVVLQYDGAHHLSHAQRLRDMRRDAAFRAAGWVVIIVTADDLRDDFARVRSELRIHLAKVAA